MISLTLPLGLTALAALIIPPLIHLIRRSDQRVVQFAALQYLNDRAHPRREWRIQERLLLLLRLFLIASLGVLLALPVWIHADPPGVATPGVATPLAPWIVLAPGVTLEVARAAANASANAQPGEYHWLAPGFPRVDSQPQPNSVPLASLLRQLDADLPPSTALTVLVTPIVAGLDAERIRLSRAVTWLTVPDARPAQSEARAMSTEPLALAVRYDAAGAAELPVARALASAWAAGGMNLSITTDAAGVPVPNTVDWLIWLGGPLPPEILDWVRRGGTVLASRATASRGEPALNDAQGSPLFRAAAQGAGRIVSAAVPLTTQAMPALLDPAIARRMRDVLAAPRTPPDRATAYAIVPLYGTGAATGTSHALTPYLAVWVALLFLIERLWCTRRTSLRRASLVRA